MRSSRLLVIAATALPLGIAAGITGTVIPAQAASTVNYVAFGDSYSSGVGAGSESGSCDQSPHAYPVLWAKANSPATFVNDTCSGDTTTDVIGRLSSLSSSTTLVSITVGGDNVGFSSIMETCVLESTSSCESALTAAENAASGTLPGQLDTLFADIRADAPNAKIIVLDYPDFYDLGVSCTGLSAADHQAIDAGINDMDGIIATAAASSGDAFADVRGQFTGHELCDSSAWLNSVTLPLSSSYHPTSAGQQDGYLPVFSAAATAAGQ